MYQIAVHLLSLRFAGFGNPTSVDFVVTDLHQMVASYTTARTVLFDLETGQAVLNLDSAATYGKTTTYNVHVHLHVVII